LRFSFTHGIARLAGALIMLLPPAALAAGILPAVDIATADPGAAVSRLVLRLRPEARTAEGAPLGRAMLADLQRTLGVRLAGATATAAGNLVIELADPVAAADARQFVNALRLRGDVVWAETERGTGGRAATTKAAATTGTGTPSVRRLIVTFADASLASAARSNATLGTGQDAALSTAAGTPLRVGRAMAGGAWRVEFPQPVDAATAETTATRLVAAGIARFAAPDYPVRPMLRTNDPIFVRGDQWSLQDVASTGYVGIDATHAWDITTGSATMVIAVVDSGIVVHPDLTGRILPGYDFVSDPTDANDGGGRDADPTDPGDWRTAGLCPAPMNTAEDSNWHGTLVAGVIAANANNGIGLAGIDWNAQVLPVRVLGRCGGEFSDIFDGMAWAAGIPVPGVPANPHPAKVINLSVGSRGVCSNQIQAIVDQILDAGVFIAVAAGNDNANADGYVPASCGGVSTVGATDQLGARASYSNFSTGMDISAPGGDSDRNGTHDSIVTTWNTGKTVALSPTYADAEGTSFATPEVAGVAALMLAVNPALRPAQIKALMAQSASPFAAGSDCITRGICGAGILNAFGAVKAARAALGGPVAVPAVEYYNQPLDHYFLTAAANEIAALDSGRFAGWQRTGYTFNVYVAATPGFGPACRFYIPPGHGDSHFFSASPSECAIAQSSYPFFVLESPDVFYIALPDFAMGACPANTVPVYRVWDRRFDTNHRYMTSSAVRARMVAAGWVAEGYGPDQVVMCAPK
jgi:serine protease